MKVCKDAERSGLLPYFFKYTEDKNGNIMNGEQFGILLHGNRDCVFCIENEDKNSEHKARRLRLNELRNLDAGEKVVTNTLGYKVYNFPDKFGEDYAAYYAETLATLVGRTYGQAICLNRNYFANPHGSTGSEKKHCMGCLLIDASMFMYPNSRLLFNEHWQYSFGPTSQRRVFTPMKLPSIGFDATMHGHKLATVERLGARGTCVTEDEWKKRHAAGLERFKEQRFDEVFWQLCEYIIKTGFKKGQGRFLVVDQKTLKKHGIDENLYSWIKHYTHHCELTDYHRSVLEDLGMSFDKEKVREQRKGDKFAKIAALNAEREAKLAKF